MGQKTLYRLQLDGTEVSVEKDLNKPGKHLSPNRAHRLCDVLEVAGLYFGRVPGRIEGNGSEDLGLLFRKVPRFRDGKLAVGGVVHHETTADIGDLPVQIGMVLLRELAVAMVNLVPIRPFSKAYHM